MMRNEDEKVLAKKFEGVSTLFVNLKLQFRTNAILPLMLSRQKFLTSANIVIDK